MRLLVQRDATIAIDDAGTRPIFVESLDLGGDVEVALRAQEEAVARSANPAHRPHEFVQARLRTPRTEPEVLRAALRVEAREDRDRFDQRGLSRPVLADEERDLRIERELVEGPDRRNRERIRARVRDALADQPDGLQISGHLHSQNFFFVKIFGLPFATNLLPSNTIRRVCTVMSQPPDL